MFVNAARPVLSVLVMLGRRSTLLVSSLKGVLAQPFGFGGVAGGHGSVRGKCSSWGKAIGVKGALSRYHGS